MDHNTGDDRFVRLRLEKLGWLTLRANRPVPPADDITEVILKKQKTGEWFVSLVVDDAVEPREKPAISEIEPEDCIGVDIGITSYIHTSENLSVEPLDLSDKYDRYAGFFIEQSVGLLTETLDAALSGARPPTSPVEHAQQYDRDAIVEQAVTAYQRAVDGGW